MAQFTVYRSVDSGAPALSGTNGSLVALLDACLVNGWTASVTSITRSGTTATVTTATAHGLSTGNSTTIAAANETDYNITAVVTVTSTTVFTYTVANSPATPATGTITWKKLGAGWTKAHIGTNKAAFKTGGGCQMYLRCQDDGPGVGAAREARIVGYETMSDVDTGTGPFPSVAQFANGMFARKSTSADATARTWLIFADNATCYVFVLTTDVASTYCTFAFGEFYSFVTSDAYRNMIIGRITENSGTIGQDRLGNIVISGALTTVVTGHFAARSYLGTGTSITLSKHGDFGKSGGNNLAGVVPYPNSSDGGLYLAPIWISDPVTSPAGSLRGRLRGFWHFLHAAASVADLDTVTGVGELAGKSFMFLRVLTDGTSPGVATIETSATLETN